MDPVAALVSADVAGGVVGQLEQGDRDVLPEVPAAVQRGEAVGAGQLGGGIDVRGLAGRGAGLRSGRGPLGQAGPWRVQVVQAGHGGDPAAQTGRDLRCLPVDARHPAVGQAHLVDRGLERRLDLGGRSGGRDQQPVAQGGPGAEVLAAQPGGDRGRGAARGPEAVLDLGRAQEVTELRRTRCGDLGGQGVQAGGVGGPQRHGDVQRGRAGLRPGDGGARRKRRRLTDRRPGGARRGRRGPRRQRRAGQRGGREHSRVPESPHGVPRRGRRSTAC